jgi:flagellar FliJ protein
MRAVLPLLIERAEAARDAQSVRLRQAQQAQAQAQGTLERLQAFRQECLARSPAALGRGDGAGMADYQRFVSRLDEAIGLQAQDVDARRQQAEHQQRLLAECQQRLLAFQTLDRRQAQQRQARELRRDQRAADEFAARAATRTEDPLP